MKKTKKYLTARQLQRQMLIDCLIYELNATQIRYKVILGQVKEMDSYTEETNKEGIKNLLKEMVTL